MSRLACGLTALALLVAAPPARADPLARLLERGVHPAIAKRAARHIRLGLPSEASRDDDRDYLLVRNGYVLSYNSDRNALNWASWSLERSDLGAVERTDPFRPDPTLPKRFYRPSSVDFRLPGYSRGHMVRAGERTATRRENDKTFVFPNSLPQAMNNNTGPWNAFEDYYRKKLDEGYTPQVIAGGVWGAPPIAARGVAVPSATWKIVVLLRRGQTVAQLDATTRVMAILVPNDNDAVKVEHNWDRYRVSVAEIERQTGLRFFDEVAPGVSATLKARVDQERIPPAPPRSFVLRNYREPRVIPIRRYLARQVAGTVAWYSPDKKYGFIKLADGHDVFVHADARLTTLAAGERVTLDVAEGLDGKVFARDVVSHSPLAARKDPAGAPLDPGPKLVVTGVTGTVKWYSPEKRFGFIRLANGEEVYVHASQRLNAFATGDAVMLDVAQRPDGRRFAQRVRTAPVRTAKR